MNDPRSYRDEQDIEKMRALLALGREANNGSYYVHTGDLNWWLHYPPQEETRKQRIYLWEDAKYAPYLKGWALLSPDWQAIDLFVHPELRGTDDVPQMFSWTISQYLKTYPIHKGYEICTIWIVENDTAQIEMLENLGFQSSGYTMQYMERRLNDIPDSDPKLPADYAIRSLIGESEVEKRAAVSYATFRSNMPFDDYVARYSSFIHSPVYEAERDIVVVTKTGDFAGFCIIWLDYQSKIGLFEPVGIHPQYQKKGIGKAMMKKGMEKMKSSGMERAMVCVEHTNVPAYEFYQSVGFKTVNRLRTYTKRVMD